MHSIARQKWKALSQASYYVFRQTETRTERGRERDRDREGGKNERENQ